jgi:hypothetical protein
MFCKVIEFKFSHYSDLLNYFNTSIRLQTNKAILFSIIF